MKIARFKIQFWAEVPEKGAWAFQIDKVCTNKNKFQVSHVQLFHVVA